MKLRWFTTYDKHGLDSETVLQYQENEDDEWEDVDFVRERLHNPDEQVEE